MQGVGDGPAVCVAGGVGVLVAGPVGVFVGSGGVVSSYLIDRLGLSNELPGETGSLAHMANDKDFPSTRISYKLDLTGPSINVQTACSTSIVAVHLACQAILSGECDMAHRRERDVKFVGQADTLGVLVHQGNEKKRQIKFELVHGRPRSKCRR